ncbi:MAG TPA: CocE/NonD family hydrolase [Candidatus Hydrogenedentes bacterium]|nr:CocE/NonD family hydrolase [Candidatus Hydrogenedentota bacterium]
MWFEDCGARRGILRPALTGFVLFVVAACAWAAEKPAEHVRVPMTDGTRLATDVYLPEGEGPWPAILLRSTYGRFFPMEGFLRRGERKAGYACVMQDLRGMGTSEGEAHVFYADGWRPGLADGADTVAWLRAQPWCNGKVASYGGSALGMTQMLLAPATRDLAAQAIHRAPASFYHHALYHGGVFRKNLVEGWLNAVFQPHLIAVYKAAPSYGPFWAPYDSIAKVSDITAPAVFSGGWHDIFQQGILDAFVARERNGGEGARGRNYLVMNWTPHHGNIPTDYHPTPKNGMVIGTGALEHALFDCYLKGDCNALSNAPKVQYFVMGDDTDPNAPGNEWRTAETWPPFSPTLTPFYLYSDGGLATARPSAEAPPLEFVFDPKDPYPTCGGPNLFFNVPHGPHDRRECGAGRTDLLRFATAPLEEPVEITGRVSARLYVSTDAPDTDFTAKLLDIYPEGDGRELNVIDGIHRVKYRTTLERPEPPLTGLDQIVELEIDLWSTSIVFHRGHRIGLHVSSSNYPRFEVNPNTGADYPEPGAAMRVARNRVHCDAAHPSALILPLRPTP